MKSFPCFIVLLTCASPQLVLAELSPSDQSVLQDIAVLHTANLERLRTWQGEVAVKLRDTTPTVAVAREARVTFAWDRQIGDWYYHWLFTAAEEDILEDGSRAGMYHNGLWYEVSLAMPNTGISHGATLTPATGPPRISITKEAFNPAIFFELRKHYLPKRLERWIQSNDVSWLKVDVTHERQEVHVTVINTALPDNVSEYLFSLAKGGNMITTKVTSPERHVQTTIDWMDHNAVYVPASVTYVNRTADGSEDFFREFRWEQSTVNKEIAEGTFSIDSLGLSKGEPVRDTRDGSLSLYGETDAAIREKTNGLRERKARVGIDAEHSSNQTRRWSALVALNLCVLLVVALVFCVRARYAKANRNS